MLEKKIKMLKQELDAEYANSEKMACEEHVALICQKALFNFKFSQLEQSINAVKPPPSPTP